MPVLINQGARAQDSYKQQVLNDTPLAYWRMDDAGSTMADRSSNGVNGTHTNSPTLAQVGALLTDPDTAIKYNGTNQYSSAAINLSAQTRITVEFWLYWAAFAADDNLASETGPSNFTQSAGGGYIIDPDNSVVDSTKFMFGTGGGGVGWTDGFPRPSANAWHHYVLDMNHASSRSVTDGTCTSGSKTVTSPTAAFVSGDIGKVIASAQLAAGTTISSINSGTSIQVSVNATGSLGGTSGLYLGPWTNLAYVDGVAQSLTSIQHNGVIGNSFGNLTVYLMSRTGSALFCSANSLIDEYAIYSGGLSQARISAHYSAATYLRAQNVLTGAVGRASNY